MASKLANVGFSTVIGCGAGQRSERACASRRRGKPRIVGGLRSGDDQSRKGPEVADPVVRGQYTRSRAESCAVNPDSCTSPALSTVRRCSTIIRVSVVANDLEAIMEAEMKRRWPEELRAVRKLYF
jgi:hypothetical protein